MMKTLLKFGLLKITVQSGTGRWADTPRFFHCRWERVGDHCWKFFTKWFAVGVWWNWFEKENK